MLSYLKTVKAFYNNNSSSNNSNNNNYRILEYSLTSKTKLIWNQFKAFLINRTWTINSNRNSKSKTSNNKLTPYNKSSSSRSSSSISSSNNNNNNNNNKCFSKIYILKIIVTFFSKVLMGVQGFMVFKMRPKLIIKAPALYKIFKDVSMVINSSNSSSSLHRNT